MNKQERKLKGIYKFKKRLKNHRIVLGEYPVNVYALKTTGKPCSCAMCSRGREIETGVKKKAFKELQLAFI